MRKSTAFVLVAATSFLIGGGSTLCLAADAANPAAAPGATSPQPSQREMHRMQPVNGGQHRQSDAAEDHAGDESHAKGEEHDPSEYQAPSEEQNQGEDQDQHEEQAPAETTA